MIDIHAHLADRRYNKDREEIINNLKNDGIELVINTGYNIPTSKDALKLAEEYDNIYATVGLHPSDSDQWTNNSYDELKEMALSSDKVVAIGEAGLDFYWKDNPPADHQEFVFNEHIRLAKELDLPLVVHSRDAHQKTFEILKAAKEEDESFDAILHCYSSSVEMMREYTKLGFYISIGGVVTFKNAKTIKEVAKEVPLDYLVLETDSPYLTPEPYRGKRNQPAYTVYVGEKIAELRGMSYQEIDDITTKNVKRVFKLDED